MARLQQKKQAARHRFSRINRHSLRNGFNGLCALSPVSGLFSHRRL
jgi:hypothetical protein